jgi:hypothetical protein
MHDLDEILDREINKLINRLVFVFLSISFLGIMVYLFLKHFLQ